MANNNQVAGVGAPATKSKKVKLRALVSLSGLYKLPWSNGQEFECDEKQAKQLLEDKACEKV